MKTVLLESLEISDEYLRKLEEPFVKQGVQFVQYERSTSADEIIQESQGADVLILANMPLGNELIEKMSGIRFIDVAFTGVDHIGLDACRRQNISVSNASGYATEAVAELAAADALSLYRHLHDEEDQLRAGGAGDHHNGLEIRGKTAGIIGLGKIGMRTAEIFHAFGAKICASKRHPSSVPEWIDLMTSDEVLKRSDIVILCCPLNDETRGMIDAHSLSLMKKNAVLINVARGPVVNSMDLVHALEEKKIAGAACDVFDHEPPLDRDDPLLKLPRTLLTPHIGFRTQEAMQSRAQIVFDNLSAWMKGKQQNIIL